MPPPSLTRLVGQERLSLCNRYTAQLRLLLLLRHHPRQAAGYSAPLCTAFHAVCSAPCCLEAYHGMSVGVAIPTPTLMKAGGLPATYTTTLSLFCFTQVDYCPRVLGPCLAYHCRTADNALPAAWGGPATRDGGTCGERGALLGSYLAQCQCVWAASCRTHCLHHGWMGCA